MLSSFCISSFFVHVSGRTYHTSIQTSLASPSSQHAGRHSLLMSYYTRSDHEYFSRLGPQGSTITAFNPLAAHRCVLHRQGFCSSVCQAVAVLTCIYYKSLPAGLEGMGRMMCLRGYTKQCPFFPELGDF